MATVFLSYSHQDNDVPQDWVNQFYKDLSSFARVYSGQRNLVIWKDDYNRDVRNEIIEDRIKEGLDKSDMLIALVSPSYLESWWGAFEREYFLRFVLRDKEEIVRRNRIMNVIKLILSPDDINKLSRDLRANYSYSFCRFQEGLAKTIKSDEDGYEKAIVALANSIAVKLKENQASNIVRIFVAKTSEDLLLDNNRIISELECIQSSKVEIYSIGNFGESHDQQREEIQEVIFNCDFALHFFGSGKDFEASKFQWEAVINTVTKLKLKTKVISWIPQGTIKSFDKVDDSYKSFIINTVMGLDAACHDFMVNSFEDLVVSMKEKISKCRN